MTKSEVVRSMRDFVGGGFITREELCKFMGYKSRTSVDRYLVGLMNVSKKYLIEEVAERICENTKVR